MCGDMFEVLSRLLLVFSRNFRKYVVKYYSNPRNKKMQLNTEILLKSLMLHKTYIQTMNLMFKSNMRDALDICDIYFMIREFFISIGTKCI